MNDFSANLALDIKVNYTVLEGFDDPNGKFANTLGNVALIDCNSVIKKLNDSFNLLIN